LDGCAHTLRSIQEADSFKDPSLVIYYAPCINHGITGYLTNTSNHCKDLVKDGYVINHRHESKWTDEGRNLFQLDSKESQFSLDILINDEALFPS
jgi:pyruvate-ferredoxin/flavodoxin oxidoreductase